MKKSLFCLLLAPLSAALAQPVAPINLQAGAVIPLPTGAAPSALAVADFNQDNRADIAVCQRGLGNVGIYVQSTAGNFPASPVSTYAVGPGPTGLVAVALGDGRVRQANDLVAISASGGYYTLLTNNGNGSGTFTPVVNANNNTFGTSVPATNPQLLATYLNGNGWVDFVYTYDVNTASKGVYRTQLSTPTLIDYRVQDYVNPGYVPSGLALDDFDRDGTTDLATCNPAGNEFTVVFAQRLGAGSPDWSGSRYKIRLPSGGRRPVQVAAGDVNRDFLPDLVVAHEGSSEVTLFLNLNNHQFGAQVSYPLSAAPRRVQLTDLNRDGFPELLVLTADNRLQIFQHTGVPGATRYGTPLLLATGSDPVVMQVVDVDGDQYPDVVVGCAGDNTVRVYLNRAVLAVRSAQLVGVEVYPNPATERVTVQRSSTVHGTLTATLFDALGRVVR